jgi:nicotinamidase/pyrazinamidase
MKTNLLIIDPQVDFCVPNMALSVPGADADSKRLADMIVRLKGKIDDIYVSLDSHNLVDIAHPIFWVDDNGNHPAPFETVISPEDMESGKWLTYNPDWQERAYDYVKALKDNGRYPLVIWPPHCLIGTEGHSIIPCVSDALIEWCEEGAWINFIMKGMNKFTEHYSALKADVYDKHDPSTGINDDLLNGCKEADVILVGGQALSHCVANTLRDLADNMDDSEIKKFVLLKDACSNVQGYENLGLDFVAEMVDRGMTETTTTEYMG